MNFSHNPALGLISVLWVWLEADELAMQESRIALVLVEVSPGIIGDIEGRHGLVIAFSTPWI